MSDRTFNATNQIVDHLTRVFINWFSKHEHERALCRLDRAANFVDASPFPLDRLNLVAAARCNQLEPETLSRGQLRNEVPRVPNLLVLPRRRCTCDLKRVLDQLRVEVHKSTGRERIIKPLTITRNGIDGRRQVGFDDVHERATKPSLGEQWLEARSVAD